MLEFLFVSLNHQLRQSYPARKCFSNFRKNSLLLLCNKCHSFTDIRLVEQVNSKFLIKHNDNMSSNCRVCGTLVKIYGPIWNSSLHNKDFIKLMLGSSEAATLSTHKRIAGVLNLASEEVDSLLFLDLSESFSVLKAPCPPTKVINSAILNLGYKVSISHTEPMAIKTNAPQSLVWLILIEHIKRSSTKLHPDLLLIESALAGSFDAKCISFELHDDSIPESKRLELCRFQENPERNWGPLPRTKSRPSNK